MYEIIKCIMLRTLGKPSGVGPSRPSKSIIVHGSSFSADNKQVTKPIQNLQASKPASNFVPHQNQQACGVYPTASLLENANITALFTPNLRKSICFGNFISSYNPLTII